MINPGQLEEPNHFNNVGSIPDSCTSCVPQPALPLRAIWFVLVGWWASLLWMMLAWAFSATLVLMPIGFWMFNRVPTITTLQAEE